MPSLVRTLILCGLLSGTQPVTIMGLLLVTSGEGNTKRKGLAYLCGAFLVESGIILFSSVVLGGTVSSVSIPGRLFLIIRVLLGIALLVMGWRMRKPAKKPQPEIPKSLERLREMSTREAFVAGLLLADYQGPVLGSMALASASVSMAGRLAGWGIYTLFASGIPLMLFIVVLRSQRALDRMNNVTGWVMQHRRQIGSWFGLIFGLFLIGDAAIGLILGG